MGGDGSETRRSLVGTDVKSADTGEKMGVISVPGQTSTAQQQYMLDTKQQSSAKYTGAWMVSAW